MCWLQSFQRLENQTSPVRWLTITDAIYYAHQEIVALLFIVTRLKLYLYCFNLNDEHIFYFIF